MVEQGEPAKAQIDPAIAVDPETAASMLTVSNLYTRLCIDAADRLMQLTLAIQMPSFASPVIELSIGPDPDNKETWWSWDEAVKGLARVDLSQHEPGAKQP